MDDVEQTFVELAEASVAVTVLAAIWPELAAIKLLTTGDERFVRAGHRYAEGVAVPGRGDRDA